MKISSVNKDVIWHLWYKWTVISPAKNCQNSVKHALLRRKKLHWPRLSWPTNPVRLLSPDTTYVLDSCRFKSTIWPIRRPHTSVADREEYHVAISKVYDNVVGRVMSDAGCTGCWWCRRKSDQAAPLRQELRRKPTRPACHPRRHYAQQHQHGHRIPRPGDNSTTVSSIHVIISKMST